MTKRCIPREQQTLEILLEHGELRLRDIAAKLGCKESTAAQYLNSLRHDGKAGNTGPGHTSVWSAVVKPKPVEQVGRVASVWEYAQRVVL